jgi:hypothetical protein
MTDKDGPLYAQRVEGTIEKGGWSRNDAAPCGSGSVSP